jgi:hypothetical protein
VSGVANQWALPAAIAANSYVGSDPLLSSFLLAFDCVKAKAPAHEERQQERAEEDQAVSGGTKDQ